VTAVTWPPHGGWLTTIVVKLGVREARKGKFYSGDALDWSPLDFRARQRAMVQVLLRALERRGGSAVGKQGSAVAVPILGKEVVAARSLVLTRSPRLARVLTSCRDPTATMYQVQRLFDWVEEVGEGPLIVERAASRARIVTAIAGENKAASKHT
jgi:hypothetical protein